MMNPIHSTTPTPRRCLIAMMIGAVMCIVGPGAGALPPEKTTATQSAEKPSSPEKSAAADGARTDGEKAPAANLEEKLAAAQTLPSDPAAWMERFINGLRTDTDQQAAHAFKLVQALIEVDRWREARPVVAAMADYRKTVALHRLATEAARDGDREESDRFYAEAERQLPFIRDFEKDEILAARVVALGARGELVRAREELAGIRARDLRADSRGRLYEFLPAETAAAEAREFLTAEKVAPSVKGRAHLLVAETLAKAGRAGEAKTVAIVGVETLCQAADVDTIPLFHQAVQLLVKLKAQAEAARWAKVCLGFAERTDVRAHWKARDMRLSAECLQISGCQEEAAAVLKSIPNLTTKLDAISYSRGGMEAASAFLLSKQADMFHKASMHVLDLTRRHPHHRARAMAAVDVLVAYLWHGMELPPEVRMHLEDSARSIENDPQFQNPV